MMDTMNVQIDGAGRIVLPKPVRERFQLEGGDSLALDVKGEVIELKRTRSGGGLKRVNGVLVVGSAEKLPAGRDFAAEEREDRIQNLAFRRGKGE
jgi:AbrB family looped-hinge helix DNA binding protein